MRTTDGVVNCARLIAPALLALLTACGREDSAKPASQVAAKVNDQEITVHQLNTALGQVRTLTEEQQHTASRQILERMIDQQLLVQKAVERRLDRDPRVVQAIEASKRRILAQAYLERVGADAAKPSAEEVKKFYAERPELFAERKIYRLQELAIAARPEVTAAELDERVRNAKSLNDIAAWLRSINVPFQGSATVKPAEQLPIEAVARLAQLAPGQLLRLPAQPGYLVVQVVATERQPLDEQRARAYIEQFLVNQRRLELARAEMKSLRETASIEYGSEFAGAAPATASTEQSATNEKAAASAAPEKPAPTKSAIEKGMAGLR